MDGIILFADDDINSTKPSFEKSLYLSLIKNGKYPILGVTDLELAEKAVRSLSSLKAFIVDYEFLDKNNELGEFGISPKPQYAIELLSKDELAFFSLIYVYAKKNIENSESGEFLKKKFRNRIKFREKPSDNENVETEINNIFNDIESWEKENQNYKIPFEWNQSINQAVQHIFIDLENADSNWIPEFYNTSKEDGGEPSIEVINLFQNLLSEKIIQDEKLREEIKEYSEQLKPSINADHYAKLTGILYYGRTYSTDPIMTGDIFKFNDETFGILITPECDIHKILNKSENGLFEILVFYRHGFDKSKLEPIIKLKASVLLEKAKDLGINISNEKCKELSKTFNEQIALEKNLSLMKIFNQIYPHFHLLPCFEFEENNHNGLGLIDFRFGLDLVKANKLTKEYRIKKLNTPYIQELRQRFFSYKGRVGVPAISNELKKWLLEEKSN